MLIIIIAILLLHLYSGALTRTRKLRLIECSLCEVRRCSEARGRDTGTMKTWHLSQGPLTLTIWRVTTNTIHSAPFIQIPRCLVQTSHNGCVLYRMKWFTYQLCGLHLVDILVLYLICIDLVFLCNLPIPNSEGECEGEERLLRNSRLLHIQDKKQLRKTRKLRFNSLNYYLHSHFLQLDILWKIHFLKVRLNSLSQPLEFLPHKIIFKSSATVVKGRFYFMFSGWFNSKF